MRVLSRTKKHNVVGAAAHQAGERLVDRRTGKVYDFAYKSPHVVHTEVLLPEGAAAWMRDRLTLWNAVERIEDGHTRRETAQLAREVVLTLPRELPRTANIILAQVFCSAEFVARGMVCDFAIHEQRASDGLIQPHVHGLLALREVLCSGSLCATRNRSLGSEGFGRKVRAWGSRELFTVWRSRWAEYVNTALAWAGVSERVDPRSLKHQGIEREPARYRGRVRWEKERRASSGEGGAPAPA